MAIITPFSNLVALVVDDMATQQTTLRGQLGMLGIGKVDLASNAEEAVRLVRSKPYGLILCDYQLNHKTDGQQLFEYLRDNELLPAECLYFMVTAENGYASVVSATEHKPDSYLLKPITAGDIEDRLKMLLERRHALLPVNEFVSKQDFTGAVRECDRLLARKDRWTMPVLQIKGQSLLQLGRPDDALAVYTSALAHKPGLIWAQLGMARAHKAANRFEEAKSMAREIIESKGGAANVDAYDVVAQSLEAQGDAQGALWALKDAAAAVPSVRRQRLVGESAYRNGDLETAQDCLAKVCAATKGSMAAQAQDTLTLSQALVDLDQPAKALTLLTENAAATRGNAKLEGVAQAIRAQGLAKTGDAAGAAAAAAKARDAMRSVRADFATIAVAKAEIMTGRVDNGLKLLQQAVSADHENPRVKQLVQNALRDTGREDMLELVVGAAGAAITGRIADAKRLFRDSRIDEALKAIEAAVAEFPENTTVLLQAAQMNCMSLRLKKEVNAPMVERVRLYLGRLDRLMPYNDRVSQMNRYYRDTVASLSMPTPVSA